MDRFVGTTATQAVMRFDPFREVDRLAAQMFSAGLLRSVPIDAYRRREQFFIHLDLPGLDPEQLTDGGGDVSPAG